MFQNFSSSKSLYSSFSVSLEKMELDFSYYSALFAIVLLSFVLLHRIYWNVRKKFLGFPLSHILPRVFISQVTGKFPKNAPFSSIIFQMLINEGKKYAKEGLFMIYTSRPVLFVYSKEAIKFFLQGKASTDKSPEYGYIEEFMGNGINTSDGEKWKSHRKLINPAFHMVMLKEKVPLFNHHALALVKDIGTFVDKPPDDILDTLKCHFFNTLSESVFGLKQTEEHKAENLKFCKSVDRMTQILVRRMSYPWLQWKFFMIIFPLGREFWRVKKYYRNFVKNVVSDMKQLVISNNTMDTERFSKHLNKSFTYRLINHHLNDPSFTFKDVYDEASTMIVAGYDTVTYSTFWCLFLLGLHPEIQDKAFSEIEQTTENYITYEDCCNLTYLESIILETLRLYPTLPIISRNLSEDVQFGKYKMYKNTTIAIFLYLLHRNPDVYPDPEKFDPDRFLENKFEITGNYVPFSDGNRNCIGKKYALIEMKIFIAHILRNFKITSCSRREDINQCWNIVITPATRMPMKFTPRQRTYMQNL